MKKMLAITVCVLVSVMMLTAGIPAVSAEPAESTGTVTINKKIDGSGNAAEKTGLNGSEFSFYKVFALENGVYNVTENFKNNTSLSTYKQTLIQNQETSNSNGGYVTYGTTTDLEALAGDLVIEAKGKTADKVVKTSGKLNDSSEWVETDFYENTLTETELSGGVKIAGIAKADELPYGVYLVVETKPTEGYVESTRPFFVSVSEQTLTDGNIDVYPKNEKPAAVKKIGSSANEGAAVMSGVYAIGEEIPYFIKTKTPNYDTSVLDNMIRNSEDAFNALTVTITDTFSKGLTLVKGNGDDDASKLKAAFTVKIGGEAFTDFTVSETANQDGTKEYAVIILVKDIYNSDDIELLNKDITVDYKAVLNQDAVVGVNDNEVTVEYNRDPQNTQDKISMTPPKPEVYTYELDLSKLLNGSAFTGTDEAAFTLTKTADWNADGTEAEIENNPIKATGANGVYNVSNDAAATATLVTKNGKFTLKGLSEGIYELAETEGVDGYAMLTSAVKIYVKKTVTDGVVTPAVNAYLYKNGTQYSLTKANENPGIFFVEVNNPKNQFTLPLTGAGGVLVIVLGGTAVLAAAAVAFVLAGKKRSK